jgi:hypothetical protein
MIAGHLGFDRSPSFATTVSQIKTGKIFPQVHEKFKNAVDTVQGYTRYSEDEIEKICQAIAKGLKGQSIARSVGMEYTPKFLQTISDLKAGRIYLHIAKKYNIIPSLENKQGFTEELAKKVMDMRKSGISVIDIAEVLGESTSRIRRLVEGIESGVLFKDLQ